ncbi:hypothetical protein [Kordiimonas laminariae]|uniref:hypothetical protein n=1 Tax=Kordiimonas laminariae TaxID=2917717 RepID=UPI001FF510D9|nr:hypothetical protein [Kordiimonas laminariae]MCK0069408.1 hypothetical protein [Kordiimonas laminariae]
MSELDDVKKLFKAHKDDFALLADTERNEIANSFPLKKLVNIALPAFWGARVNQGTHFAFFLAEDELDKLALTEATTALDTCISESLKTHNCIYLAPDFSIVASKHLNLTRTLLESLSESGQIAIFFGETGIDIVVKGKFITNHNFFYNELDRAKYKRNFSMDQLPECLKEYERYINQPGVNEAFFCDRSLKKTLSDCPKNLLKYQAEKTLRDNLLEFLNLNTQYTFLKEAELNNQRELDLYTEADGKHYILEVKWMGRSIKSDNSGVSSTNYTNATIRNGVIQTLEYIREVIKEMNHNLHCGLLCVFDVRDEKTEIDYDDFKFLDEQKDLKPYYDQHFKALNKINLDCIA